VLVHNLSGEVVHVWDVARDIIGGGPWRLDLEGIPRIVEDDLVLESDGMRKELEVASLLKKEIEYASNDVGRGLTVVSGTGVRQTLDAAQNEMCAKVLHLNHMVGKGCVKLGAYHRSAPIVLDDLPCRLWVSLHWVMGAIYERHQKDFRGRGIRQMA
jgi:hypothetical protein